MTYGGDVLIKRKVTMSIRRICLFSGPGAGKSVTAAGVYAHFGRLGHNIELVREFIKEELVYLGLFPEGFDQTWIMGCQIRREEKALRNNKLIVTDCPLLLGAVYTKKYDAPCADHLIGQALKFEERYPSLNIFLSRDGIPYEDANRYQDAEDAKSVDQMVLDLLAETGTEYTMIKTLDQRKLMDYIADRIGGHCNVEVA
jgi:nicotinamide riboside kinase